MTSEAASAVIQRPVAATYKHRDVESVLDIAFYRPLGFRVASVCARAGLTPAAVTGIGALIGVAAGHLYFYRDVTLNVAGMLLHIVSNVFDNADGQLARLTNSGSREGRILDGVADNLVFASVYLHLTLRWLYDGGPALVILLAIAAAASHSVQSSIGDFVRNVYSHFDAERGELDTAATTAEERRRLHWAHDFGRKLLLTLYLNYTEQQRMFLPQLARTVSASINRDAFVRQTRPLLPFANLLATNPRMLLLFAVLLLQQPWWYFIAEVTVFNVIAVCLVWRQERIALNAMKVERVAS